MSSSENFSAVPYSIARNPNIAPRLKALYLAMVSHADWDTGEFFVKQQTLADEVGVSRQRISGAVQELIELGLIEIIHSQRYGRSHHYRLVDWCRDSTDSGVTVPRHTVSAEPDTVINENQEQEPNNHSVDLPYTDDGYSTMGEAERLVQTELGGTEITSEEISDSTPRDEGPTTPLTLEPDQGDRPLRRAAASRAAQTRTAYPLTRDFRPSAVGYTPDDFKRDYPDIDPVELLESFFTHYISKGEKSTNWMEKFFFYAGNANKFQQSRPAGEIETDSMGFPLDRKTRLEWRRAEREHCLASDSAGQ